jgi:tRNA threonylcarbamoyladenosine biosynthesis protein TsaE
MKIKITSLDDLDDAAKNLLDFAAEEKIFVFEGDMGAGKTTFIKSVAKALKVKDLVSSPTFSIVNEYDATGQPVYHFDFYRIKNLQEAYDIGYEEYFYSGNICLIEWPQQVSELLPDSYIKTEISIVSESERELLITKI